MKHAGPDALAGIEALLVELRHREALKEKRPGVFYLKSKAFLHFHEDPKGLFADVRIADDFVRLPVSTDRQRGRLLRKLNQRLRER